MGGDIRLDSISGQFKPETTIMVGYCDGCKKEVIRIPKGLAPNILMGTPSCGICRYAIRIEYINLRKDSKNDCNKNSEETSS